MSFLTSAALFGLFLVPLLVLLHLWRWRPRREVVPSLLLWRELLDEPAQRAWRIAIPSLLLLLQVVAVIALVFSLARPESTGATAPQQIYVLDTSLHMAATDIHPTRLQAATRLIDQRIAAASSGTLITIIMATTHPYVLISSTDHDRVRRVLQLVTPSLAPGDLPTALRLASGMLSDPQGRRASILVVYSSENALAAVMAPPGLLSTLPMGQSPDNQAIEQSTVSCTADVRGTCLAYVVVRNEADRSITDSLVIEGDGSPLAEQPLSLPAHAQIGLSFTVPPGVHVLKIYLARADSFPLDNVAWSVVPGLVHRRVTLVGDPSRLAPMQRAFAALPGVTVRVRTPAQYSPADEMGSDLLVFDGWEPPGELQAAPALLLIDPPGLPGGGVNGALQNAAISGLDGTSSLLADVDLTSLDVPQGAARRLTLPPGVAPVVWSADGPLLAAGLDGEQQLAVLSFDPLKSNLIYLNAFPLLLRNLLNWSSAWLPSSSVIGAGIEIHPPSWTTRVVVTGNGLTGASILKQTFTPAADQPLTLAPIQPGIYTVSERGSWGIRTGQVAVNLIEPPAPAGSATAPIPLGATTLNEQQPIAGSVAVSWWPWLVMAATLAIVVEWLYAAMHQER